MTVNPKKTKIGCSWTPKGGRSLRNEKMCETRQVTTPVWSYQDFKTKVLMKSGMRSVVDLRLVNYQK